MSKIVKIWAVTLKCHAGVAMHLPWVYMEIDFTSVTECDSRSHGIKCIAPE